MIARFEVLQARMTIFNLLVFDYIPHSYLELLPSINTAGPAGVFFSFQDEVPHK